MNNEVKALLGLGVVVLIVLGLLGYAFFSTGSKAPTSGQLVRSGSHQTGPQNAKVTLVEFGDYQCPACEAAYPIITQIEKDYQGKINFVFRNFPLPQHNNARMAAEVAEASGEQGKYFEMYNKLYTYQNEWSSLPSAEDKFLSYAKDLGLDTNKIKDAVSQNKFDSVINQDQSDGTQLGVNSTPTFFLNGEKLLGVPKYQDLKTKIDSLLK